MQRSTVVVAFVAAITGACDETPDHSPGNLYRGSPLPLLPSGHELSVLSNSFTISRPTYEVARLTMMIALPMDIELQPDLRGLNTRARGFLGIEVYTDSTPFSDTWVPTECEGKPDRDVVTGRDRQGSCDMGAARLVYRDIEIHAGPQLSLLSCRARVETPEAAEVAWSMCASMKVISIKPTPEPPSVPLRDAVDVSTLRHRIDPPFVAAFEKKFAECQAQFVAAQALDQRYHAATGARREPAAKRVEEAKSKLVAMTIELVSLHPGPDFSHADGEPLFFNMAPLAPDNMPPEVDPIAVQTAVKAWLTYAYTPTNGK